MVGGLQRACASRHTQSNLPCLRYREKKGNLSGSFLDLLQFLPQDKVVEFARMKPVELLHATEQVCAACAARDMRGCRLLLLQLGRAWAVCGVPRLLLSTTWPEGSLMRVHGNSCAVACLKGEMHPASNPPPPHTPRHIPDLSAT